MPRPTGKIDQDLMNLTNEQFWWIHVVNSIINTGAGIATLLSGYGLLNSTANDMWWASLALCVFGSSVLRLTIELDDDIQAVRQARYGRVKRNGEAQ